MNAEQQPHHQITGEPMKFLTLANCPDVVEAELFLPINKNHRLANVVSGDEVEAKAKLFENGRGFSLCVTRARKPCQH